MARGRRRCRRSGRSSAIKQSPIDAAHPHFVSIPDARTEGVRAYREAERPHPLQLTFLEEAKERAWVDEIRGLLSTGRVAEAEARIAADLAPFDGLLARLCKATLQQDVVLEGWDDLLPILEEWEGPAITAITVGLTNPADLVFEAGQARAPELLIGLYSNESFPFGSVSKAEIFAECEKDMPTWIGAEEDVEFYCEISGLAELNTALIHCKHRHFLRDGRDGVEGRAPGGYVEFVAASWFMATRFLQAAERAATKASLPAGCRLVAGTVDLSADVLAVFGAEGRSARKSSVRSDTDLPSIASLTVKPWVPREDPTVDIPVPEPTLRQRLASTVREPGAEPRPGLMARLFGRFGAR